MSREDHIEMEGEVTQCGKGGIFRVLCEGGNSVFARLSGKMRQNRIRVVLGDTVKVAVGPYDADRGIITFRKK